MQSTSTRRLPTVLPASGKPAYLGMWTWLWQRASSLVLIVLLPWLIGRLTSNLPADAAQRLDGNLAVLVFGLLLITVMAVAPHGLHGALVARRRRTTPDVPRPTAEPAPRKVLVPTEEQR